MPHNFSHQVDQLRRQFLAGLPQHAHQIEDLWHRLRYVEWSHQGLTNLHHLTHKLAGSGSNFGLPEVSEAAQILDSYLQECQELEQPFGNIEREMMDQMVTCLVQVLNYTDVPSNSNISLTLNNIGEGKLVFVIDDDHTLSALITAYLEACNFKVRQFTSTSECITQLHQTPHALIMDVGIHGEDLQGLDAIGSIKIHLANNVPVILLSARTDIQARIRALRAGCTHYLHKPIDFPQLASTLNNAIHNREISQKVMIVDDEELVAQYHAEILRHAGMDVIYINNPLQSLKKAIEFKPDLIILDMHMPEVNGMELARLIREEDQFVALPIIFVTADTSIDLRHSLESLGVNAVLTKPVNIEQLISSCTRAITDTAALKNRISRVTQRATHHQQITRSYFFSAIEKILEQQLINDNSIAVYYIGVDTIALLDDKYGQTGIATLHEQLCSLTAQIIDTNEQWTDVSNLVICVLASRSSREHHQQRANQLISHFNKTLYSVNSEQLLLNASIGINYLDTESGSANSVLRHAEKAYDQARSQSKNHTMEYIPSDGQSNKKIEPVVNFNDGLPVDNLCVSYQPMISFEEQNIEHFEALIRLRTETGELIPAAKFLCHIEHSFMHIDLDKWVLKEAISAIMSDTNTRESTNLFLHVSEETLKQKSFFNFAANTIHESGLQGNKRVIFMLDEEWIPLHPDLTIDIIDAIEKANCGVCLSHAGATQATANIINNLHFDYIKLSPKLTKTLTPNSEETNQLNLITAAAKNTDSHVIATQVEDSKNLSTLWLMGVRLFQGFFIQSPDQKFHTKTDMDFVKQLLSPN